MPTSAENEQDVDESSAQNAKQSGEKTEGKVTKAQQIASFKQAFANSRAVATTAHILATSANEPTPNPVSGYVPLPMSNGTAPLNNYDLSPAVATPTPVVPTPVNGVGANAVIATPVTGVNTNPVVTTPVNNYEFSPTVVTQVGAPGHGTIAAQAPHRNPVSGYLAETTTNDLSGKPADSATLSNNNNAPATGTANPTEERPLLVKQLGAKYVGEEKGEGWRKNMSHDGKHMLTEYFSEEKKNRSKVRFDTDGLAAAADSDDDDGGLDGKKGFVIDPTTGNMHVFTENDNHTDGDKIIGTHHSSPLSGKAVAGAGMVTFDDGQITSITDQSGHYKPEAELTHQAVSLLTRTNETSKGQSPLLSKLINTSGRDDDSLSLEAKKLVAHLEKIESEITERLDKDPSADTGELEARAAKIRDALIKTHVDLVYNKEATVTLLGKTGMLTDDEYSPMYQEYRAVNQSTSATGDEKAAALQKLKKGVNRASALKQLQAPLGEAEYAKLLLTKQPKTSEGTASAGAIEQAMLAHKIAPGPDAAKRLKAALGAAAVAKLKDDDNQIAQLSTQYGVVAIDTEFDHGAERVGFEIGKKSAATMTAQQFLQTGGNEAQIRTKQRLMSEIQPGQKGALKSTPPVDPKSGKRDLKQEMQGPDASIETSNASDGSTEVRSSHPIAARLLKEIEPNDLASQKANLEKDIAKLDGSIAKAAQPDNYSGEVNTALLNKLRKQRVELQEKMETLSAEMARGQGSAQATSKQDGSNANPPLPLESPGKLGTGGHAPFAPSISTPADSKMDDQWFGDKNPTKQEVEEEAEPLPPVSDELSWKISKMIEAGLSFQEIHKKLYDEEHMSHEDIEKKLGFPR